MATNVEVYGAERPDRETVVWVSVEWLMKNTRGSVDGYGLYEWREWQRMLHSKCLDTGFGHLVESIMERGFLEGGAIGWDDGWITEGHHRLCAAILLCMETVPVSTHGHDWRGSPDGLLSAHYNEDEHPIEL